MTSSIKINDEQYDIEFIQRAIHSYNKRRSYESKLVQRDPEKHNQRQKEYMAEIREDSSCPQYQKRLATQQRYYDEVLKPKKDM